MSELGPIAYRKRRFGISVVYKPQDAVELTASGGATPSNTSDPIRVEDAMALVLTVNHNLSGSNSTDLDVKVYASQNGVDFDTEPYAVMNVGANTCKTIPITVGPRFVKIEVVNNDTTNSTKVTTYLTKWVSY